MGDSVLLRVIFWRSGVLIEGTIQTGFRLGSLDQEIIQCCSRTGGKVRAIRRNAKREREFEAGGGRENAKESREKVHAEVEVKVKIEVK